MSATSKKGSQETNWKLRYEEVVLTNSLLRDKVYKIEKRLEQLAESQDMHTDLMYKVFDKLYRYGYLAKPEKIRPLPEVRGHCKIINFADHVD